MLAAGMKTILSNLGFRVAGFSFSYLLRDSRLWEKVEAEFPSEEAGMILIQAPHLFVMHNKLNPSKGVFFVRCASTFDSEARSFRLSEEEWNTYHKFYPTERLLIVVGRETDEPEVVAEWFDDVNFRIDGRYRIASTLHMSPLGVFIKKRFEMNLQGDEMAQLKTELSKMGR